MAIVCPQCDKDDRIQKVSSLVFGNQGTRTYSGTSYGGVSIGDQRGSYTGVNMMSGRSSTDLARMLEPPDKPKMESPLKAWEWGCFSCSGILGVYSLSAAVYLLLTGKFQGAEDMLNFLLMIIIIVSFFAFFRKYNIQKIRVEEEYQNSVPEWERAIRIWDSLYYCHRNGIVFNPSNHDVIEPYNLRDYLYS